MKWLACANTARKELGGAISGCNVTVSSSTRVSGCSCCDLKALGQDAEHGSLSNAL